MTITLELVYFEAGGGHQSAMKALNAELRRSHPQWTVTSTNLQELLLPVDPIFRMTRVKSQDVYNTLIARGWTRGSGAYLRALQGAIRLYASVMERELRLHWERSRPDMVVSLIPNFNGITFRSLEAVSPGTPYVTVMTDIADAPPRFWQEPQDQYLICGSDKAYLQARLTGWNRAERVFQVSGMILSPSFYEPPGSPPITRKGIGLDDETMTLLISFGGYGSAVASTILDYLDGYGSPIQSIVLCGRNDQLRANLTGRPSCHAVGFTDRVADYMRIADVFVGKPGPGSISEALQIGLPVIVESNGRTLVQERYNGIWVEERGVGLALKSFSEINTALAYLSSDDTLAAYRSRALALRNRAVFEIPKILAGILDEGQDVVVPDARPSRSS
jgi:1,2-diacylglycerol 3-beta-galactosyltransferase